MSSRQNNGTGAGETANAAALAENVVPDTANVFYGDRSDNVFYINHPQDRIIEQPGHGTDTAYSSVSYTLPDNVENLTLLGGAAIDGTGNGLDNVLAGNNNRNRLEGGAGNDTLYGHGGNDILDGGSDADTMHGGNAHDIYYVDSAGDRVIEPAGQGTDTVFSSVSYALPAHVENLTLTGTAAVNATGNGEANILRGNENANRLFGSGGNDLVYGHGGNDLLVGGGGADRLYGGSGNDIIYGGNVTRLVENNYGELYYPDLSDGGDYIDGGSGNDVLMGGYGSDTYFFARGYGHDTIIDYRTPGVETVSDPQGSNIVRFGRGIRPEDLVIKADVLPSGNIDNVWHISIKDSGDTLTIHNQSADEEANLSVTHFEFDSGTLDPWSLAERIGIQGDTTTVTIGSNGGHRLSGADFGIGTDNAYPEFRFNIENVTGGRLAYLASDGRLKEWVKTGIFHEYEAGDLVFVPDRGAAEGSVSYKFLGTGHPRGGRTDDATHTVKFKVQDTPDNGGGLLLFGDVNGNTINGGNGNDVINGWTGNDRLNGRGGNDILHGGADNDTLDGGSGNDQLYGGAGNDTYLFGRGYGQDTVSDLEGSNSVHFGRGIAPEHLSIARTPHPWGGTNWEISIAGGNDKLIIERQENTRSPAVAKFVFESGTYGSDVLEGKISEAKLAAALETAGGTGAGANAAAAPAAASADYAYGTQTPARPDETAAPNLIA